MICLEVLRVGSVREEIAKNLLYYRKVNKITQKQLATYLGVNSSAVSNWENGVTQLILIPK